MARKESAVPTSMCMECSAVRAERGLGLLRSGCRKVGNSCGGGGGKLPSPGFTAVLGPSPLPGRIVQLESVPTRKAPFFLGSLTKTHQVPHFCSQRAWEVRERPGSSHNLLLTGGNTAQLSPPFLLVEENGGRHVTGSPRAHKTQVVQLLRARLWGQTDLASLLPSCGPSGSHLCEPQSAHL